MKTCKKCLQIKELGEFSIQKDTKDGFRTWCKDCFNVSSKVWREENSEKAKTNVKTWHKKNVDYKYRRTAALKRRYGITLEDFDRMHSEQNGLCALCEEPFTIVARVEHCHDTGKVRGLACDGCNLAVAFYERFQKQPELSERIQKYLDKARV